jgi:hypothetical protein
MSSFSRISLFHYEVVRELCDRCKNERFHFVPIGAAAPAPGVCTNCGGEGKLTDTSETSIMRLVTRPDGEMVVVPVIR